MSSSRNNYSKESRSYYSRSSSYHNQNSNQSDFKRNFDDRPLSSRLVENDSLSSPLWDRKWDERFDFDRRSREIFNDFDRRRQRFFSSSLDDLLDETFFQKDFQSKTFERTIPIQYRTDKNYSSSLSSTSRTIPVQYSSTSDKSRSKRYGKLDQQDHWNNQNQNQQNNSYQNEREHRTYSAADWPQQQEKPTRKRTTMTIYLHQPQIHYSDVNHRRTMSTSNYPSSISRTVYL